MGNDIYFTKDHNQVRRAVRDFVKKEINPYVDEWEEKGQAPLHDLFKKMGDLGFLGIRYDPKYGGEGLDHWYEQSAKLGSDALKSFWAAHALPLGTRLRVSSEGQHYCGSLIELDPEGGILIQLERGGRRLFSPHTTSIEAMDDL